MKNEATSLRKITVWDLPTRLFHWLLLAMVVTAWWSGGSAQQLDIHLFAGLTVTVLLLFRLVWGFVGGRYARFANFAYGPKALLVYLRSLRSGSPQTTVGHNPAGSWAIYAMLLLLLLIVVSGIVVVSGEEQAGPLRSYIALDTGIAWHELHEILAWSLLGLVLIHIGGVVVESRLHRTNLVAAMVSGDKAMPLQTPATQRYGVVAAVMALLWLAALMYVAYPWMSASKDSPYQPFAGVTLPDNKTWRSECGSCHQAYHPQLLPARSWSAMLAQQNDHFGEALGLDEATVAELLQFHTTNSADQPLMEAAWYINHSIAGSDAPQRITETRYWRDTHAALGDEIWRDPQVNGRGNCAACHSDAERNSFADAAMRLPQPKP